LKQKCDILGTAAAHRDITSSFRAGNLFETRRANGKTVVLVIHHQEKGERPMAANTQIDCL
jgi:hypothetical protein